LLSFCFLFTKHGTTIPCTTMRPSMES
jgi:hypothetical protein